MTRALISVIILMLMSACSVAHEDARVIVNHTIEKTLRQPSSWNGSFIVRSEKGGSLIHTTYDGEHDGDEYAMSIDTQGTGFDVQAEVRKEDDNLFVKLPKSNDWQKTTPQDLKMLGLGFTNSPIEFAKNLREQDLIIQTTERKNVYKVIVKEYEKLPITDKVTEIAGGDHKLPVESPEIYVEVNPENQTLSTLAMYVAYTDGTNVSYEMELSKKGERGFNVAENSD